MSFEKYRGRIAPTPSGFLHLGHLQTFKTALSRARKFGGVLVFRMEDLDEMRCKKEYASAAVEDLKLAGLEWDEGIGKGGQFAPYKQSERGNFYWEKLKKLALMGMAYPCSASRSQIKKLSLPPRERSESNLAFSDNEPLFPKELRPKNFPSGKNLEIFLASPDAKKTNWRFLVKGNESVSFCDGNFGEISFVSGEDFSDFLIWRKDGFAAYELAVVSDDADMKISEVVRGADLLKSTARQLAIYKSLKLSPPKFFHCEILKGAKGEKISKSQIGKIEGNPFLIRNAFENL